jgi:hypothetical protein
MACGIFIAASEMPAVRFAPTRDQSNGRTLWKKSQDRLFPLFTLGAALFIFKKPQVYDLAANEHY